MIEESYCSGYYRVQANIDLDAICRNVLETRKRVGDETKIMAVVKADGYGHGAVPVAKALEPFADVFGVAVIEEAKELKNAGIKKEIMILGAILEEQISDIAAYDVTVTVFSYKTALALSEEAGRLNKAVKVHIKLDTGMGRLGFRLNKESVEQIKKICSLPHIIPEGVFTHFACADHENKESAQAQFESFMGFLQLLSKEGIDFPIKHAANSAAIVDMPQFSLSMVRSGITTYGLYPSLEVRKESLPLLPAMEVRTHISHIKTIEAGDTVGYGSTFTAKEERVIATVPVGYADGYSRGLSGKGRVLVRGSAAPIVGRICMDQFMIDVTGISGVMVGDVVTLFGKDGDLFLPVEEPAGLCGSFNYEFVCAISKRVPRVYIKDGVPFLVRKFI